VRYFQPKEFDCRCGCGSNLMSPAFLLLIDEARHRAGVPFVISSGYRCEAHNHAIGSITDNHPKGLAADIKCLAGPTRLKIVKALLDVGFRRLGVYKHFIHADINEGPQSLWT